MTPEQMKDLRDLSEALETADLPGIDGNLGRFADALNLAVHFLEKDDERSKGVPNCPTCGAKEFHWR